MDAKITPRPMNISSLLFTLSLILALWQYKLSPHHRERVGHITERVTASRDCKVEVENLPEGGGGKFEQYPGGGTAGVVRKGDPTKSGYLTFELSGMSKINWRPTGGQVS